MNLRRSSVISARTNFSDLRNRVYFEPYCIDERRSTELELSDFEQQETEFFEPSPMARRDSLASNDQFEFTFSKSLPNSLSDSSENNSPFPGPNPITNNLPYSFCNVPEISIPSCSPVFFSKDQSTPLSDCLPNSFSYHQNALTLPLLPINPDPRPNETSLERLASLELLPQDALPDIHDQRKFVLV